MKHHWLEDDLNYPGDKPDKQTFQHPIIGQEAICPDGLGRVIAFKDEFPHQWIQVSTYVNDRHCQWAPHNIELINPHGVR